MPTPAAVKPSAEHLLKSTMGPEAVIRSPR
jgi:hypothetical protein